MKQFKKQLLALGLAAALTAVLPLAGASAWGPERPMYTNAEPADHATFNSIIDNPVFGDERDFVRIVEKDAGETYSSDITVEPGKQYEVIILYHNNASSTVNDAAHDYAGMAYNAKVIANFPTELTKDERGQVSAIITADNTNPESVWDEAYITASDDMTLHYVTGSAVLHNNWGANGSVMSIKMFSEEGDYLGVNELNGVVLGCYEYSGFITYTIQTYAVEEETPDEPVEPDPEEPDEPTPEVPEELPNTGPFEIGLAIVILVALAAAIAYWAHTRKAVKHATKRAKGKK